MTDRNNLKEEYFILAHSLENTVTHCGGRHSSRLHSMVVLSIQPWEPTIHMQGPIESVSLSDCNRQTASLDGEYVQLVTQDIVQS